MHIPDGFLANRIAVLLNVVSAGSVFFAARRHSYDAAARAIPLMGVLSAFVFAAQLLNFPVFGGTSGHLVGGALLGILLGPIAGFLCMATVVIAQALFMQDGGLVALGANIFNIGAVPVFSGYAVHRLLARERKTGMRAVTAGFAAGWISMMLPAVSCSLQLSISNAIPLAVGLPAMAGYHAIIGIAEGGLTAAVISFLARVRPELLKEGASVRIGIADWAGALLLVAVPFGIFVLGAGSDLPDPLETVLEAVLGPAGERGTATVMPASGRLLEYMGLAVFIIGVMAAAWLAVRLGRGHGHRQ